MPSEKEKLDRGVKKIYKKYTLSPNFIQHVSGVGRCCPLSVSLYNHFRTTETLVLDLDDVTHGYFGSYLVTSLLSVLILYLEVLCF